MEFIFILLVVLIAVVLVGHGIWVAVAWLLRGGRSRHSSPRYEPTLSDDRAATARSLQRLRTRGVIDEETHARVMRALAEDVHPAMHSLERSLSAQRARKAQAGVTLEAVATTEALDATPAPVPPIEQLAVARPRPEMAPRRVAAAPPTFQHQPVVVRAISISTPRRSISEILLGFMAEKNIRWGELIGGLLIVCCSAALVISLWSRIEAIPVLKFVIFTAMTAALFGAGLFVHHRWKIPTTGHVVLLIATLLVPLNLLAFAAFSLHGPVAGSWTITAEVAAVALFGWLALLAARVVMPDAPRLFAGGVVGVAATSLIARFVTAPGSAWLWAAALLPVVPYLAVMGVSLRRLMHGRRIGEDVAQRLFLLLGAQTFACLAPLGLIAYESRVAAGAVDSVAPAVCALACPAMLIGLFVWRRCAHGVAAQLPTAAASVTLVAVAVMLLGVALAWPTPSRLIPATIIIGLAMAAASRITSHGAIHGAAAAWFAAAWVLCVHAFSELHWSTSAAGVVLAALFSARTGQALVGAVAVCALLAVWFGRHRRRRLTRTYTVIALIIAAVSVVFVTAFGFGRVGDPAQVTWVYAVYAVAAFVMARRAGSPLGVWCGGVLAQLAIVQLLVYLWPVEAYAWPTALLVGVNLCAAGVVALRFVGTHDQVTRVYRDPLGKIGVSISLLASAWLVWLLPAEAVSGVAVRMAWLSTLWLVLAFAMRWSPLITGAQVAMAAAACAGLHEYLEGTPWYSSLTSVLLEPRVVQSYALMVGAVCLAWAIVRTLVHRRVAHVAAASADRHSNDGSREAWPAIAQRLLNPGAPLADYWMTILVVAALVVLSLWSMVPGIVGEHGWRSPSVATDVHVHAAGAGSWFLLGTLAAVLLLSLAREVRRLPLAGILVMVACAASLVAARFEDQHRIVTALRWLFASVFLASSIVIWTRAHWTGWLDRMVQVRTEGVVTADSAFALLCALFALPAAVLTITFAQAAGMGAASLSSATSLLGLRALLLGPAVLIAVGLMGHGHRARQPALAVATTVLASVVVTVTEFCALHRANLSLSYAYVVWLVQLNVLLAAAVAIVWRLINGWETPTDESRGYPRWPLLTGRAALGCVLFIAGVDLWVRPGWVSSGVVVVGTVWGFLAVVLVGLALRHVAARPSARHEKHAESLWALFGVVLVASALARLDTGNWLCFHTLLAGLAAAGWLRLYLGARDVRNLLGSGWQETFETASARTGEQTDTISHDVTCSACGYNLRGLRSTGRCPECNSTIARSLRSVVDRLSPEWAGRQARTRTHTATAVLVFAALATLFALRAALDDPQRPWWSVAVLGTSGVLGMVLAGWAPRRVFAYAGGACICLAASVWWATEYWGSTSHFAAGVSGLMNVNVIAMALAGLAWFGVERWFLRRLVPVGADERWSALHCITAFVSSAGIILLAGVALCGALMQQPLAGSVALQWSAWAAAVALMIACRLDPAFRHSAAGLYGLGLAAVVLALARAGLTPSTLAWALSMGFAAYVLMTALAWRRWAVIEGDSPERRIDHAWLMDVNGLLACVAGLLGLYVSFTNSAVSARMFVAGSAGLCALAAASAALGQRRELMQSAALGLVSAGAILLVWAWVAPETSEFLLQRAIGLVAAVSAVVMASTMMRVIDRGGSWATAVARNLVGSCVLAAVALLYCSGVEAHALAFGRTDLLGIPATTALIVALSLLMACCVAVAMLDRLDPLRLPAGKKGGYVYTAELLAAALVLHVRATMPWLFSGVITHYWPMLVIGLAVAAIAASEALTRRGLPVLARPLGRTGLFLPALVLIELVVASSQVHFSVVLLMTGSLYAVLAALRKSIGLGLLAAIALNGSLWYLLYRTPGLGLWQHPQLWLIPPALAVLVASHLHRTKLDEQQRAALHYVCLLVVYLSSAADVFLVGVAQAPWLPLVLAGLSLLGILAGFIARVRSFLLLGTGFLCLSLLTMIWHATSNLGWTWLWYVTGIILGVGIIAIFALLEKKRSEMNAWIEEVRSWAG